MSDTQTLIRQAPKTGPWIIGYAACVAVSFAVVSGGLVTDTRIGMLSWIPMLLCVGMIVFTSWKRHKLLGTLSSASRAFWRRIVTSSLLMFGGFAVSALLWEQWGATARFVSLAGLLPYAGFAGMIWSAHQYIVDETDEYLRMQAIRQVLIASAVTLLVAALWGGLANARLLSPGWIGMVILIWFGGMGLGRLYNEMRP